MSRPLIVAMALLFSIVAPGCEAPRANAQEKDASMPIARSIHVEASQLGSLEDVLHIRKCSGSYELGAKAGRVTLVIDLYREGKKVESHSFSIEAGNEGADSGKFSVQVIDLDYLPLGDGKKRHHRIQFAVTHGNTSGGGKWDVPKSVFDTDSSFGNQLFLPRAGTATEVPLFHMILMTRPDERGQNAQHGGSTVEGVVAANKRNNILVARLVVTP